MSEHNLSALSNPWTASATSPVVMAITYLAFVSLGVGVSTSVAKELPRIILYYEDSDIRGIELCTKIVLNPLCENYSIPNFAKKQINETFRWYPDGLLTNCMDQAIVCDYASFYGQVAAGAFCGRSIVIAVSGVFGGSSCSNTVPHSIMASEGNGPIKDNISGIVHGEIVGNLTLCHENVLLEMGFPNGYGAGYHYDRARAIAELEDPNLSNESFLTNGFIDAYAMYSPDADLRTLAGYLFVGGTVRAREWETNPLLRAKISFLYSFLRKVDPRLNDAFLERRIREADYLNKFETIEVPYAPKNDKRATFP